MKHFKFYTKEDILSITKTRRFETKIGERVCTLDKQGEWPQVLTNSKAKYVIVGIPEDIGVMANYGTGGTDTAWLPFLSSFLNKSKKRSSISCANLAMPVKFLG